MRGIPNLIVLTVTTSEARMTDILKRLEGQSGGAAAFLFKAVDATSLVTPAIRLLLEPWERRGLPPLCISRPI